MNTIEIAQAHLNGTAAEFAVETGENYSGREWTALVVYTASRTKTIRIYSDDVDAHLALSIANLKGYPEGPATIQVQSTNPALIGAAIDMLLDQFGGPVSI